MDWKTAFYAGIAGLRRRPGLALGLYALGLAFALVVVLPVGHAFGRVTAYAALPRDLSQLTAGLWWAILKAVGKEAGLTLLLALVLVPVHGLVRAAVLAGAAAALRPGDLLGFWAGVGRYGLRGVGLALIFLGLALAWTAAVAALSAVLALLFSGETGTFWTQFVLVPTLFVAGLAVLDLWGDYARAALVVDDAPVGRALRRGISFPHRNGTATPLYLAWFGLALALWLLPFAIDSALVASVWMLLVLQQLALFARAATGVGWVGSSVALYADAADRARIWLADAPPEAQLFDDAAVPPPSSLA